MPKYRESKDSLFARLTRLFKSGPVVRRKVRTQDTTIGTPDTTQSSGMLLFQRSQAPTYATITANAYNLTERLMRYQDFQEMEYTPEIATALDIYADEAVSADEKGRSLHVYSDNAKIKGILEDLFYGTLNIEFNARPWVRNLCKFGDFVIYNDVSPDYGVMNAFPIPINEVEREENYDPEDPFAVRFRWVTLGNRIMENWECSHFRLLGNDMFLPYGSSVIEPARRIWRQLILIEDAMLVYRIVRAPERRVFYIDVAGIPSADVDPFLEKVKQTLKMDEVVDHEKGRTDLRYNALAVDKDYILPVRGSDSGTKIETLAGGQNTAAVEDVQYIQKKLFSALKIPKAYLGFDEMLGCLSGDTQIPLLSGCAVRIDQLSGEDWAERIQKGLYTYSCDPKTGKIVPGKIVKAWKTKDVDVLYKVTLDDGNFVTCTNNHPFMCRDGSYKRVDELEVGQSLMPLYRKMSSRKEKDFQDGYEKCLDNQTREWKFTHRIVNEAGLVKDHESRMNERSYVIHHVDCNKANNSPENLVKMGKTAHVLYHAQGAQANLLLKSSRDKLREVMKTDGYRSVLKKATKKAWENDDGSRRAAVVTSNTKYKRRDIDLSTAATAAQQCETRDEFYKKIGVSYTGFERTCRRQGVHHGEWLRENIARPYNHKVLSVEVVRFESLVPVYDLEIEDTHNFSILTNSQRAQSECTSSSDTASGTFVHNSKATLSQEDIRFSRTINVIQRTIISELNKIAIIHLFANGFKDDDLMNFTLRLSNPSTVAQQQKLELIRARFDIAGSAPENMVDRHYLQTEVLGLNEEEIEKVDDGLIEDAKMMSKLEAAGLEAGEGGGSGGGGGAGLLGGSGGGAEGGGGLEDIGGGGDEPAGGGEEPEAGGEEEPLEAGADPDEEPRNDDDELLLSVDDPSDKPIKANAAARHKKDQYNRDRRDDSRSKGHKGPDFVKMTGANSRSMKNVFDTDFIKAVSRMSEDATETSFRSARRIVSPDIRSMLGRMSQQNSSKEMITESIDVQSEIDRTTESPDLTIEYEDDTTNVDRIDETIDEDS